MRTSSNKSKTIIDPDAYYLTYDATYNLAKKGHALLPRKSIGVGTVLRFWWSPGERHKTPSQLVQLSEIGKGRDDSRYSGINPDGKRVNTAIIAGVYSHSQGPMTRAPVFSPLAPLLVSSSYTQRDEPTKVSFRSTRPFIVADMRELFRVLMDDQKFSAMVERFFKRVRSISPLLADDHSISRGISHGVYQLIKDGHYSHRDLCGLIMSSGGIDLSTIALFDDPLLTAEATRLPLQIESGKSTTPIKEPELRSPPTQRAYRSG